MILSRILILLLIGIKYSEAFIVYEDTFRKMCKIVMVSRNAGKTEQQIFSELNTRLEHLIEEQRLKLGQKAAAASSLITKSDRTRMKDVVSTFITNESCNIGAKYRSPSGLVEAKTSVCSKDKNNAILVANYVAGIRESRNKSPGSFKSIPVSLTPIEKISKDYPKGAIIDLDRDKRDASDEEYDDSDEEENNLRSTKSDKKGKKEQKEKKDKKNKKEKKDKEEKKDKKKPIKSGKKPSKAKESAAENKPAKSKYGHLNVTGMNGLNLEEEMDSNEEDETDEWEESYDGDDYLINYERDWMFCEQFRVPAMVDTNDVKKWNQTIASILVQRKKLIEGVYDVTDDIPVQDEIAEEERDWSSEEDPDDGKDGLDEGIVDIVDNDTVILKDFDPLAKFVNNDPTQGIKLSN